MRTQVYQLLVTLVVIYQQCHCANIMVLEEVLSKSHHLWFKKVTAGLVAAGHNMTVVTPQVDVSSPNVHYIYMDKVYETIIKSFESHATNMDPFDFSDSTPFAQLAIYCGWLHLICRGFVESTGWEFLKNYPNDFKFDLVIHDFPSGMCLLSFLEKFNNPPMIQMTAYGDYNFIAYTTKSALIPSMAPHIMLRELKPTFFGRIENFLLHMYDYVYYNYVVYPKFDEIVASSFRNLPPLKELAQRSIISIFNYDAAIDGVRQLPPNVIGVSGLHIELPKALTGELKSIADTAKSGLVLFSLGSNVRSDSLGVVRITHILKAFANFPDYTFLWKFESDSLPVELPNNVFIQKWIPHSWVHFKLICPQDEIKLIVEIVAHKNTKLFITLAGLLSIQEAIWHGVPILNMPVFLDQSGNSFRSIQQGIAEELTIKDLTSSSLTAKIEQLLSNDKYKKNVVATSKVFRDQKDRPLDRGLWWIEWALRNPDAAHFKSSGHDLNFFQIQSIDVIVFLMIILMMAALASVVILRKLFKVLFCRKGDGLKYKMD